ncbi:MAG: winged helix-turn-helix domain-containing protein [Bacteroidota bacterium]
MANRITNGSKVRKLEPKVMEVLACMASRPGETVTKDEFMAEVWTGTIVTDDVLARCISELRKALGDKARSPSYVETIRKRGYRVIAPVDLDVDPDAGPRAATVPEAANPPGLTLRRPETPQRVRPTIVLWGALAAIVAILGATLAYRAGVEGVRPLGATPVTSYPGNERDPALSPDGERVAFAWDGEGSQRQFDLYVQRVDEGNPSRLTTLPTDDHSPAWSPDGEEIAFARCSTTGACGIYTVESEAGGAERLIVDTELAVQDLTWSPDGQMLAFSGRRGRQGAYSLHLLPLDGSNTRRLTSPTSTYPGDLDPAFSPDGRQLAFVRTAIDGRQDVAVVTVQGGRVRRLAREQKGVTGLDWTANGRDVVYAANREGAAGLWRVSAQGGEPQWIALGADGGEIASPSVARRGGGVAFARQMVRSQIVEVNPDGGVTQQLLQSTRDDRQPAASPNGQDIAFISTRSGTHEVWKAWPDGQNAERMSSFDGARVSAPRWSPDGRSIAVSARAEGNADIFLVLAGGETRALTRHPSDDVAPSWSADGEWIYFASNRGDEWQIYRVPTSGGDPEPVTVRGGVAAAEVPGVGLLVIRPRARGLWRLPIDETGLPRDQGVQALDANLSPADWANWTVVGDQVYTLERRFDRSADIYRLDPATETRTRVATVEDVPEDSGIAVFPDGERILLAQQSRADSDIVVVEDFE